MHDEFGILCQSVEPSIPNAKSTLPALKSGYKTILVPTLLVVNDGAAIPAVLKSILLPVLPLR